MTSGTGVSYRRLVPAALLGGDAATRADGRARRTVRDVVVDALIFVLAVGVGLVLYGSSIEQAAGTVSTSVRVLDLALGIVACLSLGLRRRYPVGVAVLTVVLSAVSISAAAAALAGEFTVAVHRRTTVAVVLALTNVAAATVFTVIRPQELGLLTSTVVNVAAAAAVLAWGMFVRAQRQLIGALRERAERAEGEQRVLAEQTRLAERTRIAREMHDVLAHRISLLALHAGGLQVRPDVGTEQVRETAVLLRTNAHQALEELREVIGVLREDNGQPADPPARPQPTLGDIPRLVDESRQAGTKIDFCFDVADGAEPPDTVGRDAYRVVQEALTNVAKHAGGTATSVRVTGGPGSGLRVDVRNRLPLVPGSGRAEPGPAGSGLPGSGLPGSGTGLLGLSERVDLAGGTLTHGPTDDGDFVVDARLAW